MKGQPSAGSQEPCFDTSHYDIGYDPGSVYTPSSGYHTFLGALTGLFFSWVQWLVVGAMSILRLAYTFGFASNLAQPVAGLAKKLQHMVEQVGWPTFALVATVLFAGVQILLKGRTAHGITEIVVSVLIGAAFPAWILSHPDSFITTTMQHTSEVSGALVELTSDCHPNCPTPPHRVDCPAPSGEICGSMVFDSDGMLLRPLARQVHQTFVEEPYMWINWGTTIPPGSPCYERLKVILQDGPWGTSDAPRWIMKAGHSNGVWPHVDNIPGDNTACSQLEQFNRTPTLDRLAAAATLLIPAGLFVLMTLLIAMTLIGAEIGIVALAAGAAFAWACGQLPERFRGPRWGWCRWTLRCVALIVATSGFLAFWLFTLRNMMSALTAVPIMSRMSIVGDLVIVGFVFRRKLGKATKRTVAAVRPHLGAGVRAAGGGRFLEDMTGAEILRHTEHGVRRVQAAHRRVKSTAGEYRYGTTDAAGAGGASGTGAGRYRYGEAVRLATADDNSPLMRGIKATATVAAGSVVGGPATERVIEWSRDPRTRAVLHRLRPEARSEERNN